METETMLARDAYICQRILRGIQKVADHTNFEDAMSMYKIIGALEFHMYGFASLEFEIGKDN